MATDEDRIFQSQLRKLLIEHALIPMYKDAINQEVDRAFEEAKENGINNFYDWLQWMAEGKGASNAGQKDSRRT